MAQKPTQCSQQDTDIEMMRRVFAVAELIVRSNVHKNRRIHEQKKHTKTQN